MPFFLVSSASRTDSAAWHEVDTFFQFPASNVVVRAAERRRRLLSYDVLEMTFIPGPIVLRESIHSTAIVLETLDAWFVSSFTPISAGEHGIKGILFPFVRNNRDLSVNRRADSYSVQHPIKQTSI